jgi:hypothetical protein
MNDDKFGKELEGNGRIFIEVPSLHSPGGTDEVQNASQCG